MQVSYFPSFSRKNRRGIGLLDATLGLIIFSLMLSMGIQFLGDMVERNNHRQEARQLAEVNAALLTLLKTDPEAWRKKLEITPKHAIEISKQNLKDAGIRVRSEVFYGVNGRVIDMWMVASTQNELIYFSRATGTTKSHHYPEPNISHGAIGSVISYAPDVVQGAGLLWDIRTLRENIGLPIIGDVLAVGYFNLTASHVPYLSRLGEKTADGTDLSKMKVNLDMGGNSIINVDNVTANKGTFDKLIVSKGCSGC